MSFSYNDPIVSRRRAGTSEDPYVPITESVKVTSNSKLQLTEVPDKLNHVVITNLFEVQNVKLTGLNTNEFHVDYAEGIVTVHSSRIGQSLTATYYGTGTHFFPASRVYTKVENGNVVETLGEILDVGVEAIEILGEASQILHESQDATQAAIQATQTINSTNTSIASAESVRVTQESTRQTNETTRNTKETERQSAETSRASAEASRVTAESGRTSAESTRATNESNRVGAETSRVNAETGRVSAESTRSTNETTRSNQETTRQNNESTRGTNETARISAETSRITAESGRVTAEGNRVSAETSRSSAESGRVTAESTRVTKENARQSAEDLRVTNENTREDNELDRIDLENGRISAESNRVTSETARSDAESSRTSNETTRQTSESQRVSTESSRVTAESGRVTAENTRISNESSRVSAESSRVTAETGRSTAESTRASQESTRQSNETTRQTNETARQSGYTAYTLLEAYNNTKAYVPMNKVTYSGSTYQCILASTGNVPTNTTYWTIIAQKGADGTGSGTVLSVSSANADISIGNPTSTPVLTLNSGTGANQIVKLDSSGLVSADILKDGTVNKAYTATEKTKLSGVTSGATKTESSTTNGNIKINSTETVVYTHPTGDGNLHVPSNGTTNNGKVVKSNSTAGSIGWGSVDWAEITTKPTTASGYGITDVAQTITSMKKSNLSLTLSADNIYTYTSTSSDSHYSLMFTIKVTSRTYVKVTVSYNDGSSQLLNLINDTFNPGTYTFSPVYFATLGVSGNIVVSAYAGANSSASLSFVLMKM